MAFERKLKEEFQKKPDYDKMKLPELKKVCEELSYGYDVPITGNKDEILKRIKLIEADKDIGPPIYETINGVYYIGVHKNDVERINQVSYFKLEQIKVKNGVKVNERIIEDAYFSSNYHFYITTEKIKLT